MSYITKEYALQLLKNNQTPERVILHCMEVARVSEILAVELNKYGYNLSVETIKGAAMLHDIARVDENHGEIGAIIAEAKGYLQEADIIKSHMYYSITKEINNLREIDIVCLADRMVKENEYVGLKRRMDYILSKFKNNPRAQETIKTKILEHNILLKKIEDLVGKSIDDLMIEKGNK